MGLLNEGEFEWLLACPRCRARLEEDAEGHRCSSASCQLSAPGSFGRLGPWPVLLDEERSTLDRHGQRQLQEMASTTSRFSISRLPPILRRVWKPSNRVAVHNVRSMLKLLDADSPVVLVVGGGTIGNGIGQIYTDSDTQVLAFDIYGSPEVQFVADAHDIPVSTGSVDAVVVQAVLEHVLKPERVVSEIHRVLRPGGLVYAETPFLQQVHAGAFDFTRYTSSGHRYLFRSFEELSAGPIAGPGTQLLTSVDHLARGLARSEFAGKLVRALFFWLRYLDHLVPTEHAMDNASAYYFLGRRWERELSPKEILAYYRGAQSSTERGHMNDRTSAAGKGSR